MSKQKRFLKIGIVSLLVITSLYGCTQQKKESNLTPIPIFSGDFKKVVETKGTIKPFSELSIVTPEGIWGTIEKMIPEGTIVKKGDIIAKINIREFIEAYSGELDYFNSEQIDFEKKKADFPLEIYKLQMENNNKKNNLKLKELELKLLKKGAREDLTTKADTDIEISNIKISNHSLPKKKLLYQKGYLSEQELNSTDLEFKTLETDLEKAKITKKQLHPEYNKYELDKANLSQEQAKLDLKINNIESQAQKATLKVKTKNSQFKIKHYQEESKRIKEKITMADLHSPMDGILIYPRIWGWRKPMVGMEVWEGFSFLSIAEIDNLKIESKVNELEIINVKIGLPVEIKVSSLSDTAFKGKVIKIGKLAKYLNEENPKGLKYFDVDIEITKDKNPKGSKTDIGQLKPNMTVNIKIINNELKKTFYVPVEALMVEGDKYYVYFEENGKPVKKQVNIKERGNDYVSLSGVFTGKERFYLGINSEQST